MSEGCKRFLSTGVALFAAGLATSTALAFDRDGEIERMLEDRIDGDPDLARLSLDVRVEEGRVQIDGRVRTLTERRRALIEAGRVHGVLEVVDRLELEAPRRSDETVRSDLEAIARDRLKIGTSGMKFDVSEGVVSVSGDVEDARLRIRARNLAESVEGVLEVLVDVLTPERDDQTIEAGLVALLAHRSRARVRGRIEPRVEDGVAILSGDVPRPYERMIAEEIAWGVNGVTGVVNELTIVPRPVEIPLVRP